VSETIKPELLVHRLASAILRLSWPPGLQRRYLQGLGISGLVDELVLEFDDAFKPVAPILDELGLSQPARESVRALDEWLVFMSASSPDEVWLWDALDNADEWTRIRDLATQALEHLPRDEEPR
jgi:hypothetical protein